MEDIFQFKQADLSETREEIKATIKSLNDLEEVAKIDIDNTSVTKQIKTFKDLQDAIKLVDATSKTYTQSLENSYRQYGNNTLAIKKYIDELKASLKGLDGKDLAKVNSEIENIEKHLKTFSDTNVKVAKVVEATSKNTKAQYKELNRSAGDLSDSQLKQAGMLKDAYADQIQQIKILSSDTKKLDFGIAAIGVAANGYQALTGTMQLFGIENEDVLAGMAKLQSIMAITSSLREIQNALLSEGTIRTLLNAGATGTLATAEVALAGATETATAANVGFAASLSATGIGAIVVGLGLLVAAFVTYKNSTADATEAAKKFKQSQDNLILVNQKAATNTAEQIIQLNLLADTVKKGGLSFRQKEQAVADYNETFGKSLGQVKSYTELEQKLIANLPKYIEYLQIKARGEAAYQLAIEKTKESLTASIGKNEDYLGIFDKAIFNTVGQLDNQESRDNFAKNLGEKRRKNVVSESKRQSDELLGVFKKSNDEASKLADELNIPIASNTTVDKSKVRANAKKDVKEIKNIYADELLKVEDKLNKAKVVEFESAETLKAKVEGEVNKYTTFLTDAVKKGELTTSQSTKLLSIFNEAAALELEADIKKFNAKKLKANQELNKELAKLEAESTLSSINLLQDKFDKENQSIEANLKIQKSALLDAKQATIDKITADTLIDPEKQKEAIMQIEARYKTLLANLETEATQKKQANAFNLFEASLDGIKDQAELFKNATATRNEIEVQQLQQQYNDGAISYEKYQKELTKIAKKYALERLQDEEKAILARLEALRAEALDTNLTPEQKKSVDSQISSELLALSQNQTDQNTQKITNKKEGKNNKGSDIEKRIAEYKQLSDAALTALKTIADAEQRSLDKKIARQEKALDKARLLAEKGNNSLVEIEQEKLTKLEAQKEKAAKRQLQIDSALQASSILTAVAGATAKIATGNTADVITGIATIISSLGAGYALVKSYQDAQPTFFKGTDRLDVKGGSDRLTQGGAGTDDINARLHHGEAVIQSHLTDKYQPLIKAIRRDDPRAIQAFALRQLPQQVVVNSGISKRDINELKDGLASIRMNVNLDQNGFMASLESIFNKKNKYANG